MTPEILLFFKRPDVLVALGVSIAVIALFCYALIKGEKFLNDIVLNETIDTGSN